jgi:hypothetical protein
MAKIIEENIVIKISRLAKDGSDPAGSVTTETLQALEQVTQELVGDGAIVEITQA